MIYNTCLERLIRNGGAGFWTDAVYQLAGRLNQYRSSTIDVVDWGMMDSLRLLDRGQLRLDDVSFLLLQPEWGYEGRKTLATAISEPNHLFVNHIDG